MYSRDVRKVNVAGDRGVSQLGVWYLLCAGFRGRSEMTERK